MQKDGNSMKSNRINNLRATLLILSLTAPQSRAISTYVPYTFATLAGKAGTSGSLDGTNSAARFNVPGHLAVDRQGRLYVND